MPCVCTVGLDRGRARAHACRHGLLFPPAPQGASREKHFRVTRPIGFRCGATIWWLWRGVYTRSHLELGRENPQRRWYFVLRRGRVGRRQVFPPHRIQKPLHDDKKPRAFPTVVAAKMNQPGLIPVHVIDAGWSSPEPRRGAAERINRALNSVHVIDAGWSSPEPRRGAAERINRA
jgi:hypothetical protein